MRDESYLNALHQELVALIRSASKRGISDFDLYEKLRMNATYSEMQDMLARIVNEGFAVSEDFTSCAGLGGATYTYQAPGSRPVSEQAPKPAAKPALAVPRPAPRLPQAPASARMYSGWPFARVDSIRPANEPVMTDDQIPLFH